MARKRQPLSVEDLIAITEHSTKRFVRYDEGVECQVKLNTFSQISRIELNTLFYP